MKMRKGAIHVQYVLSMFETRTWCPNTQVYLYVASSGERAKLEMRVTFGGRGGGWWRK